MDADHLYFAREHSGLSGTKLRVYEQYVLAAKSGQAWPSKTGIAERLTLARKTVTRVTQSLECDGYLSFAGHQSIPGHQGKTFRYTFPRYEEWQERLECPINIYRDIEEDGSSPEEETEKNMYRLCVEKETTKDHPGDRACLEHKQPVPDFNRYSATEGKTELPVTMKGMTKTSLLLTNAQSERADAMMDASHKSKRHCPTCGTFIEWGDHLPGRYVLDGQEHECECETQMLLFRRYLLAGIPEDYMRLDWETEFRGSQDARTGVEFYLDHWATAKVNGIGIEFGGRGLGTGKTFAATTIAKELVKRGEGVCFMSFREALNSISQSRHEELERAKLATFLVLDEVQAPRHYKTAAFYDSILEDIFRTRTDWCRPTAMTTNLEEDEFQAEYPRIYSVMHHKSYRVSMTGEDARQSHVSQRTFNLLVNNERRPIT